MRRGRFSEAGAEYFLTLCTAERMTGLVAPGIAQAVLDEAKDMMTDGSWILNCAVVMPDHVHLLATLGGRLPLGKAVQRLKAKSAAALRLAGISWERGFFDRRMRPDDERLPVFLYIYLNPYRAGLLGPDAKWPHYYCREEEWEWFGGLLHEERPVPEWLM